MKRILFVFLIVFNFFNIFSETYNYYERNEKSGEIILKNIEYSSKYDFPKYELSENQVIGYYYKSEFVKFIDIISDGKIISTKYFVPDSNEICNKKYFYDSTNRLIKKSVKLNDEKRKIFYKATFFLKYCENYIELTAHKQLNGNFNMFVLTEGKLDFRYNPIEITNYIEKDINESISIYKNVEKYLYDKKNRLLALNIKSNDKKVWSEKIKYSKNQTQKIIETFNFDGEKESRKTDVYKNSQLIQILEFNNSESKKSFNYQVIDNAFKIKSFINFLGEEEIIFEILDEIIAVSNNSIQSRLKLFCDYDEESPYNFIYQSKTVSIN